MPRQEATFFPATRHRTRRSLTNAAGTETWFVSCCRPNAQRVTPAFCQVARSPPRKLRSGLLPEQGRASSSSPDRFTSPRPDPRRAGAPAIWPGRVAHPPVARSRLCSGRPGVPASGRAPPQGSACRSYSPSLAPNLSDARSRTALTFSLPWARDWDSSVLCPGLHQSRGSRLRLPSWEQASLKQLSTPRSVAAFLRLLRDLGPSPSSSWRTTRARSS